MYIGLHVKYPLFLSDFKESWILSTYFRKIFKYQTSWKSVQWEPSSSMRMDGQTDGHNEASSRFWGILRTHLRIYSIQPWNLLEHFALRTHAHQHIGFPKCALEKTVSKEVVSWKLNVFSSFDVDLCNYMPNGYEYDYVGICPNYELWTGTLLSTTKLFIHSIGMCGMRRFLAVLRSFFHSSLLYTLYFHHFPPTSVPSSITSSCHLFLGLTLNLVVSKFI